MWKLLKNPDLQVAPRTKSMMLSDIQQSLKRFQPSSGWESLLCLIGFLPLLFLFHGGESPMVSCGPSDGGNLEFSFPLRCWVLAPFEAYPRQSDQTTPGPFPIHPFRWLWQRCKINLRKRCFCSFILDFLTLTLFCLQPWSLPWNKHSYCNLSGWRGMCPVGGGGGAGNRLVSGRETLLFAVGQLILLRLL